MANSSSPTSGAGGRSSQLRRDDVFGRWVIFSPARARRPSEFKSSAPATGAKPNPNRSKEPPSRPLPPSCPFCIGNEHQCAPEIFRLPAGAAEWRVRVIENLYPALRREEEPPASDLDCREREGGLVVAGYGFHDVIIETPYHGIHLSDLSPNEAGDVVFAYRERVLQLASLGSIKYVQIFKNHGASAGASMSHSHSQIMGLPLIPPTVSTRFNSMKECYDMTGKCNLCETWSEEILIHESQYFCSIVPFAASFPFEIWIVPRDHASHFHEIDKEKAVDFGGLLSMMLWKLSRQLNDPPFNFMAVDFGGLLSMMLRKLSRQLNDPPFNFMIHTSPFGLNPASLPYAHWFLQIVPQLSGLAGFEMGSGCYINPVFPEDSATVLREVDVST